MPTPEEVLAVGLSDDEEQGDADNQGGADEEWDDWEGSEGEGMDADPTASLFEPSVLLPSPEASMDHDAKQHAFDLRVFAQQARLDDYGVLRVINYIRTEVQAGRDPRSLLAAAAASPPGTSQAWEDDKFLLPVLQEDALLCYDFSDVLEEADEAGPASGNPSTVAAQAPSMAAVLRENRALAAQVAELQEALGILRIAGLPADVLMGVDTAIAAAPGASGSVDMGPSQPADAAAGPSAAGGALKQRALTGSSAARSASAVAQDVDESYFDSYSGFNIHREMLSDKPRTDSYRDALEGNPGLLLGKTVLDLGCGTGILSLIAARAGAKHVVAVDGSQRIAGYARQIVQQAGFAPEAGAASTISVVSARIEQLQELPQGLQKVDVIVSEWMGYALLFETMLDSVLAARDRWLAPGGVVLPDLATIYCAGATAGSLNLDFWQDVYGFQMEPIAQEIRIAQQSRASVLLVEAKHLVTSTATLKVLDLVTMRSEEQDFTTEFCLTPSADSQHQVEVAAVVLWFDTAFSAQRCPEAPVLLSTSPRAPPTHWAQTVLPLRCPVRMAAVGPGAAVKITGRISMSRNRSRHRSLDIALQYQALLADGSVASQDTTIYAMSVLGE